MEQVSNGAAAKDAQILPSEEECAVGMGRRLCRYEGCTKQDQRGGMCRSHVAKHKLYS